MTLSPGTLGPVTLSSLSSMILILPFLLQAGAISVDEFYFHRKRGLGLWELISHPIDTLCLLACLAFAITQTYNATNLKVYIALCLLSCLLITKDEGVHRQECTAAECWLHSVLFIVHPVVLITIALIWKEPVAAENFHALWLFASAALLFLLYQIVYALIKTNIRTHLETQRIPRESTASESSGQ
jgi:hypothetical protein